MSPHLIILIESVNPQVELSLTERTAVLLNLLSAVIPYPVRILSALSQKATVYLFIRQIAQISVMPMLMRRT